MVIVTGGAGGLGGAYCDFFSSRGANILLNDMNKAAVDVKVQAINEKYGAGRAVGNYDSVAEGGKLVKQAFDKWGRVDVRTFSWSAFTRWT